LIKEKTEGKGQVTTNDDEDDDHGVSRDIERKRERKKRMPI